jgi:protein TonB
MADPARSAKIIPLKSREPQPLPEAATRRAPLPAHHRHRTLTWFLVFSTALHVAVALWPVPVSDPRALRQLPQSLEVSLFANPGAAPARAQPDRTREPARVARPERSMPVPAPMAHTEAPRTAASGETTSTTPPVYTAAYLNNPPPVYPASARRRHQEGVVTMQVWVDDKGRAGQIRVTRSSGVAVLDEAAQAAVNNWIFVPAHQGATPVSAWVEVPVRFRLEQAGAR